MMTTLAWPDEPRPSWDHGVWEALAATLAEPLRRALTDHYDGCDTCQEPGIWHCTEGLRLWDMLPDGDKVVLG